MWNDPNLDNSHPSQSTSDLRDRRRRDRKDPGGKEDEPLIAFGYEAFLFQNDNAAQAIEEGHLLITWQGQDPNDENSLWLDRYDARNLLDDERFFTGFRDISGNHHFFEREEGWSKELDEERYQDLDSDEELLFDMDEDDREEHLAQKRAEQESSSNYRGVHYAYDKDENNHDRNSTESAFQLHFEVPERMSV
ncbi:hypothetical protein BX616_004637, partial [Lobosporangium transversale]